MELSERAATNSKKLHGRLAADATIVVVFES
jgi:hypothetical protein